jgi:hypothetical protein
MSLVAVISGRYFSPILTKFGISWKIFKDAPNINFHRNQCCKNRKDITLTVRQIHVTNIIGAFHNCANTPDNIDSLYILVNTKTAHLLKPQICCIYKTRNAKRIVMEMISPGGWCPRRLRWMCITALKHILLYSCDTCILLISYTQSHHRLQIKVAHLSLQNTGPLYMYTAN